VKDANVAITTPGIKKALRGMSLEKAISEYVWNGFDANATFVDLTFTVNDLQAVTYISVRDNGDGIPSNDIDARFGIFMHSEKEKYHNGKRFLSRVRGKRGMGRLSFFNFCNNANWDTVYKSSTGNRAFNIEVVSTDLVRYSASEGADTNKETGTMVLFSDIFNVYDTSIKSHIVPYLKKEFCWFLKLNNDTHTIRIDGVPLDYSTLIAEEDTANITYERTKTQFHLHYVRWKEKPNDEYSRYYCEALSGEEKLTNPTTFNNKGDDFYHSVFLFSNFFDNFSPVRHNEGDQEGFEFDKSMNAPEFKFLMVELNNFLRHKRKPFLQKNTDKLINEYLEEGILTRPINGSDWEVLRYDTLEQTVRQLYLVQPKIFARQNNIQKRIFVKFLNLLLDSQEFDRIFGVIKELVDMDPEERQQLGSVLKASKLSSIVKTIDLIQARYTAVDALRRLVFDENLKANEVKHIQSFMENNFWLIGEEYNLVTAAEPKFEEALKRHHCILTGEDKRFFIDHPDKNGEMDLFLVRQDVDANIIKNVVVELKHPRVRLGRKQLEQVDKYFEVIFKTPEFNSCNMTWEFHLLGNKFDESGYIERQLQNAQPHGERHLVFKSERYKIFVKTWSDVISAFELRHNFLNQRLQLSRQTIADRNENKTADDLIAEVYGVEEHVSTQAISL
jgi:hypothetical protein